MIMFFDTPAQLRAASNVAHWGGGVLLLALSVTTLRETRGALARSAGRYLYPALISGGGFTLVAFLLFRRGMGNLSLAWTQVLRDPQQIEHLWLAAILMAAGGVETLHRANLLRSRLWELAVPLGLASIGSLLWMHIQYGTPQAVEYAKLLHRVQGSFLFLAGAAKTADVLWPSRRHRLRPVWIVCLFISAVLLLTYREPLGAYEVATDNHPALGAAADRLVSTGGIVRIWLDSLAKSDRPY